MKRSRWRLGPESRNTTWCASKWTHNVFSAGIAIKSLAKTTGAGSIRMTWRRLDPSGRSTGQRGTLVPGNAVGSKAGALNSGPSLSEGDPRQGDPREAHPLSGRDRASCTVRSSAAQRAESAGNVSRRNRDKGNPSAGRPVWQSYRRHSRRSDIRRATRTRLLDGAMRRSPTPQWVRRSMVATPHCRFLCKTHVQVNVRQLMRAYVGPTRFSGCATVAARVQDAPQDGPGR